MAPASMVGHAIYGWQALAITRVNTYTLLVATALFGEGLSPVRHQR